MDYKSIIQDLQDKKFKPIYLLQGEEPYYIDLISKEIEKQALEEHERDFNQSVIYGKDVDVMSLITDLNGFPMMAERRLIVVREAQDIKDKEFDLLEKYITSPNETTVFVLCYKFKKLDSRKKIYKEITKKGVVFTSDKIKDYQIPQWIESYLKNTSYSITPKASKLLSDSLGNDLSRITNELDKLSILIQKGTTINEIHIEENIGISKDFNVFELVTAIQLRDVPKIFQIVDYFEHNPKSGPLTLVIAQIFGLFIKLMRVHFLTDKSQANIAAQCKVNPYFVKDYLNACKLYNPTKIANNIALLNEYDLKSKGLGSSGNVPEGELMKELIYRLIN
jgi:DNA polymerase III subunit delta